MTVNDILTRESENAQQLHIYEEGGRWYAYGRSAQVIWLLQRNFVNARLFANHTRNILLTDRMEVDFKNVVERFTIVLCSDTELTLKCPE